MEKRIFKTSLIIGMTVASLEGTLWLAPETPQAKATENTMQSNQSLFTRAKTDELYVHITSPLKAWKESISGQSIPGTKIELFIDGQLMTTKHAGNDGNWKVERGLLLQEGQKIQIRATLGLEMMETKTYTVGMGAPIFINDLNNDSTKVTGLGSAGAKVSIKTSSGSELGSATIPTGGFFEVTIPKQPKGSKLFISQARNGEESEVTEVEVGEAKDILAPTITAGLYKGSTKISGKATPKATVFVSVFHKNEGGGAGTVANVRADDGGNWETGVLALKVGDIVRTSSSLGGVNITSEAVVVAPDLVKNVNYVTSNSTKVTGKGTPGATAQVWVKEVGTLTKVGTQLIESDGTFQVTIPKQAEGTKLYVYQEENKVLSNHVEVTVAKGLDKPTNINSLDNNSTELTGNGVAGAIISVKANGKEIASGEVAHDGSFEVAIPKQIIGTKLSITQAKNGDESEAVIVSVAGQLPAPKVSDFYMGSAYIRGTVSAGTRNVMLTINGHVVRIGDIDDNGNYSIYANDVEALTEAGASFGIVARDANNGLSEVTMGKVKEFPAPEVDPYQLGQTYMTGTVAEETSRIAVHDEVGRLYRVGQVNENGTFRIYVGGVEALQSVGSHFVVKATNATGTRITETKGTVLLK